MRIYRVECPNGKGIFQSGMMSKAKQLVAERLGVEGFWETNEPDPYRHPNAGEDPILRKHEDLVWNGSPWHFGFKSMDMLTRWFDSEHFRRALNDLGARVVTYEVSPLNTRKGAVQYIFRKDKAQQVATMPLPTLSHV